MRHKHADEIIAWANGAEIQIYKNKMGDWMWVDTCEPMWLESAKYRIKPESKPDLIKKCEIFSGLQIYDCDPRGNPNLKLTFDGETGELKAAEVMK